MLRRNILPGENALVVANILYVGGGFLAPGPRVAFGADVDGGAGPNGQLGSDGLLMFEAAVPARVRMHFALAFTLVVTPLLRETLPSAPAA